MKLIKELGVRSNGTRGYMWAVFECPTCGIHIERMKHQGKAQTECPTCARISQKAKVIAHGDRYSRLYRTWINMKTRCYNTHEPKYQHYGAKGITVCDEWHDYVCFKEWALSNGYDDTLTIDRIRVTGNYCPSNVQFISNNVNAGKDKIKITAAEYAKIVTLTASGIKVKDAYTSLGYNSTAYYNAKKRYKNDS